MDETALIQTARHGDIEAFNRLVLAYQDYAYSVAYRIMGDAHAASDATQEAFIAAYRKLDQFRGDVFKAWLTRIVVNACYDELRKSRRRPAASLDELEDVTPADGSGFHAVPESPEQHVQRVELQAAIQDCINALPDDQRVIAVLCDVEGYTYQDIVTITDLPLGTVKSRLSRARGRLRDCLQGVRELLPAAYRLMNE